MQSREAFTPFVLITGVCLVVTLAWFLFPAKPDPVLIPAVREHVLPIGGEPIQPISANTLLDQRKVALGKRLFEDSRLSKDDTVSCSHCHDLSTAGVDGRPRSLGIRKREGERNAPTVFNACLNYRQFWDGRAASLEEQIDGPTKGRSEMASDWPEVMRKLGKDADYRAAFDALYPDGIQAHTIKDAIATFERSLVTPDAPFDQFLRGDRNAISAQAVHGYQLFKTYGCVACHQGANVGGNMMQPFGVMVAPGVVHDFALRKDRRLVRLTDIVANVAVDEKSNGPLYKVPGLRNVAQTAPYFHDGSVQTLPDAVRVMGIVQLGRRLSAPDIRDIVAFLNTLTGKYEGETL